MSSDELRAPLLDDSPDAGYDSVQPKNQPITPLPKLQMFNLLCLQFGEPVTATVIYPFVVQLVRDTGITGGDEAKTGYYAGIIVSDISSVRCFR